MSTQPSDDQWLEVLAGRAEPTDASTRQAAKARDFHLKIIDADLAAPRDEQRLKRLLNAMDAQAAQERAATPAPAPRVGPVQALLGWLFPAGGGNLRYAGAAAAVMGLAVALFVGNGRTPEDEDAGTMKSLPGASSPAARGPGSSAPLVVLAPQPLDRAIAVQAALKALGIEPQLSMGTQVMLQADVPAAKQADVQQALGKLQINWPGGAQLNLVFQSAP